MATNTSENNSEQPRDYGFDIHMESSAIAISTVASKSYRKQCSHIYNEFLKNMRTHMNVEKEARKDLDQLKKEKITNMKYSLYRSAGEDLFSSAKERRHSLMDNTTLISPLVFDDSQITTPWGLDPIIDEDLIRPQTAPSNQTEKVQHYASANENIETRPKTAFNSKTFLAEATDNDENVQNVETTAGQKDTSAEHVRFQTPTFHADNSEDAETDASDSDKGVDGVVDTKLERTRARRITINADKFSKLSTGVVIAKLKNKDGNFLIKPVSVNFTPNEVDSFFIAKDPSKERMALVRKQTNCKSTTVASDLKVNNRIAIMKSLLGKEAKKTTVAEIFDHARDRKTKHFRILLKNPPVTKTFKESVSKVTKAASFLRRASQALKGLSGTKSKLTKENSSSKAAESQEDDTKCDSCVIDDSNPGKPEKIQIVVNLLNKRDSFAQSKNDNQNVSLLRTNSTGSRKGAEILERLKKNDTCTQSKAICVSNRTDSAMSLSRGSISSPYDCQDSGNFTHSRLMFARQQAATPQQVSRSQTPRNRSYSAFSMRGDNLQLQGTDKDMTEMIRRLVETRVEGDDNRPASSLSMMGCRPNSSLSMAGSRYFKRGRTSSRLSVRNDNLSKTPLGYSAKQMNNERMTKYLIKEQMRKDMEYQESMETMRRRVAVGSALKMRR